MNIEEIMKLLPITTKNVKGKEYLYFTYYDQNTSKKKEVYCGLATKKESKKKALEFEVSYLREQKNNIDEKVQEVEKKLKHLN